MKIKDIAKVMTGKAMSCLFEKLMSIYLHNFHQICNIVVIINDSK